MSYYGAKDYNLEVLKGNVTGSTMVSIFGHDQNLSTSRVTVYAEGTTADIDQSGIEATPATVTISSDDANDTSAGTGLRTFLLQGLDAGGVANSETITMNGQTGVTSANTYSAIIGMRGLTWGSGKVNAGVVYVGSGSVTSGVPAVIMEAMEALMNKALTAYYVVPAGKTLYFRSFSIMAEAGSNRTIDAYVCTSSNGVNWVTEAIFPTTSGVDFQGPVIATPGVPAGTHVKIAAEASGANTDITVIMACELVDD